MSGKKPHDNLFQYVLSRPEHAAEHLKAQLPPEIVSMVRWETLSLQPGTFVDTDLEALHSDLLFEAKLSGRETLYLYLLCEHQSMPDPLLPIRLLRYMVRIWSRWLEQNKNKLPLPFLVPLVLYNGERRWNVPRDLAGLVAERHRESFASFLPDFTYVLQDLCRTPDEDIRGAVLYRLTLLWMKRGREEGFWEALPDFLSALLQLRAGPGGLRDIEALLRYLVMVSPREMPEDVRRLLTTELAPDAERWWMTWVEQVREEERKKAEEERKKAETRLLVKLRQRTLSMLQLKFGTLPEELVRAVEGAPEEQLDRIAERVPIVNHVEELLA
jgi:predicted transposase YdaD